MGMVVQKDTSSSNNSNSVFDSCRGIEMFNYRWGDDSDDETVLVLMNQTDIKMLEE